MVYIRKIILDLAATEWFSGYGQPLILGAFGFDPFCMPFKFFEYLEVGCSIPPTVNLPFFTEVR